MEHLEEKKDLAATAPYDDDADASASRSGPGRSGPLSDSDDRSFSRKQQDQRIEILSQIVSDDVTKTGSYEGQANAAAPTPAGAAPLNCSIGFAQRSLKGEDMHDIRDSTLNGRAYKMVGVYDGHGGKDASLFASINLLSYVEEEAAKTTSGGAEIEELEAACKLAFERCHADIRAVQGCSAGTTATLVIVDVAAKQALCCNVGDSSLLVVDASNLGFASVDHRLHTNPDEQDRVLKAGSKLAYAMHPVTKLPAGSLRMWPGGLAVSRALGDADCGEAVCATPATKLLQLPPTGAMLLLCSDGVWDSLGMYEVGTIARGSSKAGNVANDVVNRAIKARGLRDDTTCVTLLLGRGMKTKTDAPSGSGASDDGKAPAIAPWYFPFAHSQSKALQTARRIFRSCCMSSEGATNMDSTSKGGMAFEVLYRGEEAQVEGVSPSREPNMDASVTGWAGDRVGSGALNKAATAKLDLDGSGEATTSITGIPKGTESPLSSPKLAASLDASAAAAAEAVPRSPTKLGVKVETAGASDAAKMPKPIPAGRKIHWNELGDGGFSDMKFLGAGEFCAVFSTYLDGGHQIAIKMLRPTKLTSASANRDLEFEMHLMSRMKHKNILRCVGTSVPGMEADRKFLALQMIHQTLHAAMPPPPLPDGTATLARMNAMGRWPMTRALRLGLDLASALRYLHDACFATFRLLHRDIKPKNLGLMIDGRLVVFDFGISKLVRRARAPDDEEDPEGVVAMTGMCGSLRYMAPEVASSLPYDHRSEIYSFSMVLWEMLALRKPYDSITEKMFEERVCLNQERPKLNEKKWSPALCSLLVRCWAADFESRPEFKEIVDILMTLIAEAKYR